MINRIYQGRVRSVRILPQNQKKSKSDEDWQLLPDWQQVLWKHHELFQDAINYYLLCLMALANDPETSIYKIKSRILSGDSEYDVWNPFWRNGKRRKGMRQVAFYLGLDPESVSFENCLKTVLEGNDTTEAVLGDALKELLFFCSGDSKIQQEGRSMLPRFVNPSYKGSFPFEASSIARKHAENYLIGDFHDLNSDQGYQEAAREAQLGWVVNIRKDGKPFEGEAARERLLKAADHFLQFFGIRTATTKMGDRVAGYLKENTTSQNILEKIRDRITNLQIDELPSIPPNAKSIPDRLEALILFKYFPRKETADLLKVSFPRKENRSSKVSEFEIHGDDPIKISRGPRGYVFRAFTSLNAMGAKDDKSTWLEFDIQAFKEALKTLHQIDLKEAERNQERDFLEQKKRYMEGKAEKFKSQNESESFELPPVIEGDPRIERIKSIRKSLKTEYSLTDGVKGYGIDYRTVRGFKRLCQEWQKLKMDSKNELESQKKLKATLNKFQKDNKYSIGSVLLFEQLIEPENWKVWQKSFENTPEEWIDQRWALNPLDAYAQYLNDIEQIERLKQPIRFTPADAVDSPRQYAFGDKQTFKSLKGENHHVQGETAVVVSAAVESGGRLSERKLKLEYSAPRFLRDGLRNSESEKLHSMPWQQPMMKAFGEDFAFPQEMSNFPVFLMPREDVFGRKHILLNFPITIDQEAIIKILGKRRSWDNQFVTINSRVPDPKQKKSFYLKWPNEDWGKIDEAERWYQKRNPFSLLSIDLGQRDAGAFAIMRCQPDSNFGTTSKGDKRRSRFVGETASDKWFACPVSTGMIRLPGEDAQVIKNGKWVQESYGERGRLASEEETARFHEILHALQLSDLADNDDSLRFFPSQNDLLLYALKRHKQRLAKYQRWSWMLLDELKSQRAKDELLKAEYLSNDFQFLIRANKWELIQVKLTVLINEQKQLLSTYLHEIANRVMPLKRRSWEWIKREDSESYILRQMPPGSDETPTKIAGQRGLSIERIEQIENLRILCQGINKALQHIPGERPKHGHHSTGNKEADPCPEILEKLDRLKTQRVNQTAHLILCKALGLELKVHETSKKERRKKDIHGEYKRVRDPVDFIVLEDLNRYLTGQGRTRRENSRLMQWSHRSILNKLKELCETWGIPVLEVAAGYSSRFSAGNGTPGFRAKEVAYQDRFQYPWKRILEENGSHSKNVKNFFDLLEQVTAANSSSKPRTLLAPIAGGPIFVGMDGCIAQADINAAINIGLRAIAEPSILDVHQKIRTEKKSPTELIPLKKSKREKVRWAQAKHILKFEEKDKLERNSNCFISPNFSPLYEKCRLDGYSSAFATTKGLWGSISTLSWGVVEKINQLKIQKNGWIRKVDDSDLLF